MFANSKKQMPLSQYSVLFEKEFGIDLPNRANIRRWERQFKETECVCSGKTPCVSGEQMEEIRDEFEKSPCKFSRRASLELEISSNN